MQVKVHLNFTFRLEPLHELFREEDGRMQLATGLEPPTIEVHTQQAAPVVAMNDPIWVQHWNYFENKFFSKNYCFRSFR